MPKTTAPTPTEGHVEPDPTDDGGEPQAELVDHLYNVGLDAKLAAVTTAVHSVAFASTGQFATEGKDGKVYRSPAISIEDVENLIGPLYGRARIASDFTYLGKPEHEGRVWTVNIEYRLSDADSDEERSATLWDIGGTPSAAVSFAIKRYLKALHHIATHDDEGDANETREELVRDQVAAAERRRDTPPAAQGAPVNSKLPKGITQAQWDELLGLALSVKDFVPNPEWADRKLTARLVHHLDGGKTAPEIAHKAMRAELLALMPAPAAESAAASTEARPSLAIDPSNSSLLPL